MVSIDSIKIKFRNVTNGTKYITHIINTQVLDERFRNDELELLLRQHPNTEKVKQIEYLIVKIRDPYRKRSLYIKNVDEENEQDVSYKYCLKALFGKYSKQNNNRDRILRAFRDSVSSTKKRSFFLESTSHLGKEDNFTAICANCKSNNKLHVDHFEIPFQKILDDFLSFLSISFSEIEVCEENNLYVFSDKELAERWVAFHDEKVQYRLLCPPCNLSFNSYGYRKIKNLYK